MNKNKKLFIIFQIALISLIVLMFLSQTVFAYDYNWNIYDNYEAGETGDAIYQVGGTVINILTIVAATVGVAILVIIGIRYMTTAPMGRAEIKKQLPFFITGAVISFAALAILKVIQIFIEENINTL